MTPPTIVSIVGFEGKYTISQSGEVFSLITGIPLRCTLCTSGYPMAKLFKSYDRLTGKRCYKHIRVHKLVADHFIPNPEGKPCVNHKDGNKSNNHVSNLEHCTHKENSKHAFATGLTPKKERYLSDDQLQECSEKYTQGVPISELAVLFGVSRNAIEKYILPSSSSDAARKLQLAIRGKKTGVRLSIPIHQYTLDDVFVKTWDSMILAAKTLGLNPGNISNVAANRCKSTGGFIWKK